MFCMSKMAAQVNTRPDGPRNGDQHSVLSFEMSLQTDDGVVLSSAFSFLSQNPPTESSHVRAARC